jgi:hypothetical protein
MHSLQTRSGAVVSVGEHWVNGTWAAEQEKEHSGSGLAEVPQREGGEGGGLRLLVLVLK